LASPSQGFEDKIGGLLRCNGSVREKANRNVEVSTINPIASAERASNKQLTQVARHVARKRERAVAAVLESGGSHGLAMFRRDAPTPP